MLHSANATQTARMFPGLSGVKGPFAKSFATVIKARGGPQVEGERAKQRAKCP